MPHSRTLSLILSIAMISGCSNHASANQPRWSECPNLTEIGDGSSEWEHAMRCVRVMAARYTPSGQSPSDISTAAIKTCEWWWSDVKKKEDPDFFEFLMKRFNERARISAITTVVQMRTSDCMNDPGIFDHINDDIKRPAASELRSGVFDKIKKFVADGQKFGGNPSKDQLAGLIFNNLDMAYEHGTN